MENLRTLPIGGANKKGLPQPLLTYVVLLSNGKSFKQQAHTWCESEDDEGSGISYNFYREKTRVLSLEFSEVRAVLCEEHCNVEEAIAALLHKPRKKGA